VVRRALSSRPRHTLRVRARGAQFGAEAADAAGSGGLLRGKGTLPPTDTPTLPPPIGTPMPTPMPIDSQAASNVATVSKAASMRFIDNS
jgi:hypothetical protein